MTILVASAAIRHQPRHDCDGGVYLIDIDRQRVKLAVDWKQAGSGILAPGRQSGLRGIEFDGERVFVAASEELLVFTPDFELIDSYTSPYLRQCQEICRFDRRLYLASSGFDSVLGFDLDRNRFTLGLHVRMRHEQVSATPYDPNGSRGPAASDKLQLNTVHCDTTGLYISGSRTEALLIYTGSSIDRYAGLPQGAHNARPFRDGIVFNDTAADVVRYVAPADQRIFAVPRYAAEELEPADADDAEECGFSRQAFGRGLCTVTEQVIAAGSSPATVALHSLGTMQTVVRINLSTDSRAAINGLEVWPYPVPDAARQG